MIEREIIFVASIQTKRRNLAQKVINPKGNMGGPISSIYDCVPNIPNNAPPGRANGIIICNMFITGWGKVHRYFCRASNMIQSSIFSWERKYKWCKRTSYIRTVQIYSADFSVEIWCEGEELDWAGGGHCYPLLVVLYL